MRHLKQDNSETDIICETVLIIEHFFVLQIKHVYSPDTMAEERGKIEEQEENFRPGRRVFERLTQRLAEQEASESEEEVLPTESSDTD